MEFTESPDLVRSIITDGCDAARDVAQETMEDVRASDGIGVPMNETTDIDDDVGPTPRAPQQEEMPFAIVHGDPVTELPRDL